MGIDKASVRNKIVGLQTGSSKKYMPNHFRKIIPNKNPDHLRHNAYFYVQTGKGSLLLLVSVLSKISF